MKNDFLALLTLLKGKIYYQEFFLTESVSTETIVHTDQISEKRKSCGKGGYVNGHKSKTKLYTVK